MTPTEVAAFLRNYNVWRRGNLDDQPMPDPRQIGEAIDAAVDHLGRLEAAESELVEIRHGAAVANDTIKALRAKIEAMERQDPVVWARKLAIGLPSFGCVTDLKYRPSNMPESAYMPPYALPGAQPKLDEASLWQTIDNGMITPAHIAQPAPSVPREAIEKMLTQLMDIAVSNGANSVSMPDEYVEVAAWLCGIPAQPAPSVPTGWKIVPIDPTRNMLDIMDLGSNMLYRYRALLAAAPKPEGE